MSSPAHGHETFPAETAAPHQAIRDNPTFWGNHGGNGSPIRKTSGRDIDCQGPDRLFGLTTQLPDLYIFVIFGQYGLGLFLRFLVVLSSPRAWAKLPWPGAADPVF